MRIKSMERFVPLNIVKNLLQIWLIVAICVLGWACGGNNNQTSDNKKVELVNKDTELANKEAATPTPTPPDDTLDEEFPGEFSWLNDAERAEVKGIKAYCKKLDDEQSNRPPDMIFADVSDYLAKKRGKWHRFSSEKALERFRKKTELWTDIAYVYESGGRIATVNYMIASPSGDWAKDLYHYYREDGSLALVYIHFGSFYDGYKLDRYVYFDRNGKLIGTSDEWSNMKDETIEPIKDGETADLREKIDYYMTVSKLPFARLLPQRAN